MVEFLGAFRNETMALDDLVGGASYGDDEGLLGSSARRDDAFNVIEVFCQRDRTVAHCVDGGVCVWRELMFASA